jgi:hypothetical protein
MDTPYDTTEQLEVPSLPLIGSGLTNLTPEKPDRCSKAEIKPVSTWRRKLKRFLYITSFLAILFFITVVACWRFHKEAFPVMQAIANMHPACKVLMDLFQELLVKWDSLFGTTVYVVEDFVFENWLPFLQTLADWLKEQNRQWADFCVATELLTVFFRRMPLISDEFRGLLTALEIMSPPTALLLKVGITVLDVLVVALKGAMLFLLSTIHCAALVCYQHSIPAIEYLETSYDWLRRWEDLRQRIRSEYGLTIAEQVYVVSLHTRWEEIIVLSGKLVEQRDLVGALKLSEEMLKISAEIARVHDSGLSEEEARQALKELGTYSEKFKGP